MGETRVEGEIFEKEVGDIYAVIILGFLRFGWRKLVLRFALELESLRSSTKM